MISISKYIVEYECLNEESLVPWEITGNIRNIVERLVPNLDQNFNVNNGIAVHKTATVESGAILKRPIIVHADCFIGAHAYLRDGVILMPGVVIGPSVEIKSSVIFSKSRIAHFNFVGDSVLGSNVNIEAGAILANHHNDRKNKTISIRIDNTLTPISCTKFGALLGDRAVVGANAVLNPGTILRPGEAIGRLEHVNQEEL